ncbi:hypothetical protein [Williamsia soli]|nr:hypothetical protein [Williamsia soli]
MSLFTKLMSVDHLMMAAAAVHPEAPPALPMIERCGYPRLATQDSEGVR